MSQTAQAILWLYKKWAPAGGPDKVTSAQISNGLGRA